ncbi:restriction endonuclease subunit S [Vibrio metoecus]
MGSKWETVELAQFVTHQKGFAFKSKDYLTAGVPVVRVSNFTTDSIDTSDFKYVSNEIAKRNINVELIENDVVIATVGSWPKNPASVVGKVIRVPASASNSLLNQNAVRLRPLNNESCDKDFLYYLLKYKGFSDYIVSTAQGSANQASITLKDIYAYEFMLPPSQERSAIARTLRKLDNKITLNRQINQTLEQMAQTLFKSWFVDFDPVMDNALDAGNLIPDELQHRAEVRKAVRENEGFKPLPDEVRQLFPDAFEESELGWVPKGWDVKTCEEISTRIGMGPFGSNIKVSTFVDNGIPVISGTHLKSVLLNDHSYNFITEEHAQKLKNSAVYRGDIVFTHAGNIGQVALIPDESEYESYMISQRQFYLRPDPSQVKSSYIVHYFHSHLGQHKLLSNASQTGVPSIARPSSHLKGIALVIPSNEVQESFDSLVTRWNEKTMRTRNNIDLLTKLRDILLPKLISGELRLDDIELAVE